MRNLAAIALAMLLASCTGAQAPEETAQAMTDSQTEQNRAIVTDFARLFYTERDVPAAFETYVVEDYIQHNPGVPDGRDPAVAMLAPMFSEAGREFRIKQIIVDGDMAVIHVHAIPAPGERGASVFDMYRLENGKIVEHWDAIQPVPETSANPHPMF